MKNLQIPEVQSLGQVLTLDEMKSICGGASAIVTCTCTYQITFLDKNGRPSSTTKSGEPSGDFITYDDCQNACAASCAEIDGCKESFGNYSCSGSGS